jgi:nitrite reductase/ring-hydroxylating ferredoxin subunit
MEPANDNAKTSFKGSVGGAEELISRRRLLWVVRTSAGVLVVGAAFPGYGNRTGTPPSGPVSAGNVAALPVGAMLVLSNIVINIVIAPDATGVYAMSAICAHAGCFLDDASTTIAAGLYCPCHGSSFDGDGVVIGGPARAALQHYAVMVAADGSLTVDGSQLVSGTTRTPV